MGNHYLFSFLWVMMQKWILFTKHPIKTPLQKKMLKCVAMNMFLLLLSGILTISQLAFRVVAITEGFIVPSPTSDSLSYREGSMLTLAWNSTLDKIALTLWQDGNNTYEYIGGFKIMLKPNNYTYIHTPDLILTNTKKLENAGNIQNTNTWPWKVFTEKQNVTPTFFFAIYRPGETGPRFSSGHFKIIRASPSSTLSSLSIPTSSSTPTFSPSSSLTPSPSNLTSRSGLNSGAKVGIGLGLGIGIPFVLALGILLGFLLRSGRRNPAVDGLHKPTSQDIGAPILRIEMEAMESRELDSQGLHELGLGTQRRWYGSCWSTIGTCV